MSINLVDFISVLGIPQGKDTSTDKVPELWLFTIRFMPPNKAWSLPRWLGAVYTQLLIIFDAITARLITPS